MPRPSLLLRVSDQEEKNEFSSRVDLSAAAVREDRGVTGESLRLCAFNAPSWLSGYHAASPIGVCGVQDAAV